MSERVLKLTQPVMLGGQTFDTLSFKALYGGMLIDCGLPMRTIVNEANKETESIIDTKAVGRLISQSAEVPLQVVRRMCPADFMAAMEVVMDFFPAETGNTGSPRTSSTATSN